MLRTRTAVGHHPLEVGVENLMNTPEKTEVLGLTEVVDALIISE